MEQEKKYVAGWWVWVVILMVGTAIVFAGLNFMGVIGKTIVERKVFESSYQKHEADKDAFTTYSAQLAQLRAKLRNPELSQGTKIEIKAQIDAINILRESKEN